MNSPACDDEQLLEFSPFASNSKSMNKLQASDDILPDSKRSSQDMAASVIPIAHTVKDRSIPESISNPTEPFDATTDLERFLGFKQQVIQEETDEAAMYNAGVEAFRCSFCDAESEACR